MYCSVDGLDAPTFGAFYGVTKLLIRKPLKTRCLSRRSADLLGADWELRGAKPERVNEFETGGARV
jgi:hypothetical protein